MTGQSFLVSMVTVGIVAAIAGRCTASPPAGLPAKTQARLIEHRIQTVIDSQRVQQLEAENARLARRAAAQVEMTRQTEAFATAERRRGDTLQAIAIAAQTSAERAGAWQAAHDSRKLEADSLRVVAVMKDSTLAVRDSQLVKKDSIISTETARAVRADARIADLRQFAAAAGDRCRILRVLGCPSRKAVAIGSVIAGGALVYIGGR